MRKNDPGEQLSISRVSEKNSSMAVFNTVGGQILELSLGGHQIIGGYGGQDARSQVFGYTMAPWPNRLDGGSYQFRSQNYQVEKLDADRNAIHGLLLDSEMEVVSHKKHSLTLLYSFGQDPSYPFALDLEIHFELEEDALLVTSTATNNSGHSIPFAIGFHPYFTLGEQFEVKSDFTHRIEADSRMIPNGETKISGLAIDQNSPELMALDDCYYGSDEVRVTTNHFEYSVTALENMNYFMLYRPLTKVFEGSSALAIEPMSHPTDVFNSDISSSEIAAGDERVFSYEIRIR
ncbi:MAG: hypothetical protein P8M68_01295 [Aquiluna sp.]|nr:hypothetical protein [Aquiluna sp.]